METRRGGRRPAPLHLPKPQAGRVSQPAVTAPLPAPASCAVLGPAPSLRVPPSLNLVPPPPPPPDTTSSRRPPGPLSFFVPDCTLSRGRPGEARPLPCPRAQTPGPARAPPSHAVRPLEQLPRPPARDIPGVGPGRGARRAAAPGRRHQETRAASAEEDGSVTGRGGSGWARTPLSGQPGRAWVFQRAVRGLPRLHGVVESRARDGTPAPVSLGVHLGSRDVPGRARRPGWPSFPTRRRPRGVREWEFGRGTRNGVPEGSESRLKRQACDVPSPSSPTPCAF